MNESNQLKPQRPKFAALLNTSTYQNTINSVLRDKNKAAQFIAGITSAVAVNPALETCEPKTILSGALLGASLNLSPSPQLGHYYLVPFNDNKAQVTNAVFVLGYKGFIQLAKRSGEIMEMGASAIKAGELVSYDPIREKAVLSPIMDAAKRELAETVGYYAWFEERNGFKKELYWGKDKMQAHANRYSKAYSVKKGESFWEKDFDAMGCKTMLRQLLSKWGSLSAEATQAALYDGGVLAVDETNGATAFTTRDVIDGETVEDGAAAGTDGGADAAQGGVQNVDIEDL